MDDTLSIGSTSEQDDDSRMQYIRKDFFRPNNYGEGEDGDDDSSNRFFVSEPSTSEADSSENLMRLGAVGGMGGMDGKLLYLDPSASEEDNLLLHLNEQENNDDSVGYESSDYESSSRILLMDPLPMPSPDLFLSTTKNKSEVIGEAVTGTAPPLPPNAINATTVNISKNYNKSPRATRPRPSSAVYSPDNTSLSSHDTASSSRWNEKIELDFSSVRSTAKTNTIQKEVEVEATSRKGGGKIIPSHHPDQIHYNPHLHSSTIGRNTVDGDSRTKSNHVKSADVTSSHQAEDIADISSNSSSSASEAQLQQLGEFLDDLRINSEGQMKESLVPGSNTSFESSILLTRESEVEDVLRQNTSAEAPYDRRGPKQHQQQMRFQHASALSSRDSSTSRLFMDYSKDSFVNSRGAIDSLAMTISNDAGDYRQHQQQQDTLVGDRIEMTTSSPARPLPLPPLYSTTSTGITSGRKQQHDRQRRWSGDTDTKSLNQDQKITSTAEGQNAYHHHNNRTTNADTNANMNRNSLKSTIDNSGDEWSKQQKEIGLFSQFAIGTRDNDGDTRRARRTKQRSYRQLRKRHLRQESGEDSSSQASSDQSYINFFQSPSQPPINSSYQTASIASPTPRIITHGQGRSSPHFWGGPHQNPFSMHSPRNRSLKKTKSLNLNQPSSANSGSALKISGSYDGIHASARHVNQQSPPLQLDSNHSKTIPWGNPLYQSSPTYYFPAHNHQRVNSEIPVSNRRFQFEQHHQHLPHQFSHTRSHSLAVPLYERPPDGGNRFLHAQPHFSTISPHADTPTLADHFFTDENNHNRNHSQSYDSSLRTGSVEHDLQKLQMEQQLRDSYAFDNDISYSVSDHSSDDSIEKERDIHLLHDGSCHDNRVIRHHHLDNAIPKFDRRQFLPQTSSIHDNAGERKYPTFVCPNCKMRQREFFTVSSAPKQYESEGTIISLLFAVYVVASLYIFGLQEGWGKLDCIYFAVITLTTAGLGDLVPTTDGAKIICSIFIYFGVACIGLLLGSYIAGMLDEKSYQEAIANQIKACPNCARIKNMRYVSEQRRTGFATGNDKLSMEHIAQMHAASLRTKNPLERASKKVRRTDDSPQIFQSERLSTSHSMEIGMDELSTTPKTPSSFESPTVQNQLLGSLMTTQILQRQSHTRHVSMDLRRNDTGSTSFNARVSSQNDLDFNNGRYRHNSADIHIPATVNEGTQSFYGTKNTRSVRDETEKENQNDRGSIDPSLPPPLSDIPQRAQQNAVNDDLTMEDSDSDIDSLASQVDEIEGRNNGVRNAKYIILTLREALINSLVIIAFGCLGFYLIEGFSFVDSLYFTTVLLTSTGYGDIVPKSDGGKLFATVYLLVGGTILLNNMSLISMIPLELRKRRTEHSVLTQFGDSLDDDALRELATGPLIQRIHLGGKDSRGLDECTREMFALAMMIRLGKVTEHDIKLTFAAFRKLDVNNEGILNSKSIIDGMIQKRRRINLNNRNNNERPDYHSRYISQGYGSWVDPPVPSYFDGTRNRSSSTNSSFVPNSHGHSMKHSDHAPLLSVSEKGFPQYGMNQYPFVPTLNE